MKRRIYIDVSVLAGCVDDRYREDSRRLLDRFIRGEDIMVISELTLRELEQAPLVIRKIAVEVPEECRELLRVTDEANNLAIDYLNTGFRIETFSMDPEEIAGQVPIVRLINILLAKAISDGAGMLSLEPFPQHVLLQFYIHGDRREIPAPPRSIYETIIRRLKIIAGMNVLVTRQSQEGRFTFRCDKREFDVKVVTSPGPNGEEARIYFDEKPFLIDANVMNTKEFTTALHVALATIWRVNYLASLNPRHLDPATTWVYSHVNSMKNYPGVRIRTPETLNSDEDLSSD